VLSLNLFAKYVVYGHRPTWHGRFSFRNFAAPINRSSFRITRAINSNDILTPKINIPNH